MPKMVHFGDYLKTWTLLSNSVTRQVSFKRTKISGKCHLMPGNKINTNLPPPFFWHKYGNLQMFPNPTQNPKMVMKNCTGLFHCARSSSSAGGLTSMVTVGTVGASFRRFVAVVRLFGFKFRRNSNILRSQCLSFIMTTTDLRSKVVAA